MASPAPTAFPEQAPVDRSGVGLQYQKYQQTMTATGSALGLGRRTVPDPNAQFSNPPVSGSQFNGQQNAKSVASFTTAPGEAAG